MSNNELTTPFEIETVEHTRIESFGERDEVREIVSRLMMMHPAAQELGQTVMLQVAQLAILAGANPLPTANEIEVWADWQGKPTIDFGIAFYRRRAAEHDTLIHLTQFDEKTHMTRTYEPAAALPADWEAHQIGSEYAHFGICRGYRLSEFDALTSRGVPWQAAAAMCSRTGIGLVRADELTSSKGYPRKPPNGRSWQWVANKRAEKDLYRRLNLINETALTQLRQQIQPKQLPASYSIEDANADLFGE